MQSNTVHASTGLVRKSPEIDFFLRGIFAVDMFDVDIRHINLLMRARFVDAETGWTETRETLSYPESSAEVIEQTVTDPMNGKVYRSSRAASYARPIAEWVRAILESDD